MDDGPGDRGIKGLEVPARRRKLARSSQNSGTGDAARIDGVAQRGIAIDSGVPEVADGGETTLEVFASHLRAQQDAFRRGLRGHRQQQSRNKRPIARDLGFRRDVYVEKQVGVTVDQPGQQGRIAEIDGLDAGRRSPLDSRR